MPLESNDMTREDLNTRYVPGSLALVALITLASCVTEPAHVREARQEPLPDTTVYFYPAQERAVPVAQQDRDRYECNNWAVQQTGFDPSLPKVAPHQRVRVVATEPSGAGAAVGAVTGAVVGAATSSPWHAGRNTALGALAGAAIGGIAEAEHDAQIDRERAHADADVSHARNAVLEQKSVDYRRAMAACLEGRGYSVR